MRPALALAPLALITAPLALVNAPLALVPVAADAAEPAARVLSLSAATTDVVLLLGAADRLVAIDDGSRDVPGAAAARAVGPARAPQLDAVYAAKPSRVIAAEGAVPPEVLEQLKKAGLVVELLPPEHDPATLSRRVLAIGVVVDRGPEAKALARQVELELERLAIMRDKNPLPVPAAIVSVDAEQRVVLSGAGSSAHALLTLAGGRNVAGAERGAHAVSAAGFAALAPQVIVMRASEVARLGGKDAVLALPAIAATSAGVTRSLVVVEDRHAAGLGPSAIKAAFDLFKALRR